MNFIQSRWICLVPKQYLYTRKRSCKFYAPYTYAYDFCLLLDKSNTSEPFASVMNYEIIVCIKQGLFHRWVLSTRLHIE